MGNGEMGTLCNPTVTICTIRIRRLRHRHSLGPPPIGGPFVRGTSPIVIEQQSINGVGKHPSRRMTRQAAQRVTTILVFFGHALYVT